MTAKQQPDGGNPSMTDPRPVPASPETWGDPQCPVRAIPRDELRWEDWRIALQPIPALVDWYKKHKISGTLLVAAFVIVKGYVIARGDITTALAVVQYSGVATWAVAAVLSSLPTLAAAMLAITCFQIFWPLVGLRLAPWPQLVPVVVVAFLVCAALTPWWIVLAAVVLGLAFGGLQWAIYGLREHRLSQRGVRFLQMVILVGEVSAVAVMLYTAWLPNEIVKFKHNTIYGRERVVANVLAEDSGGAITLLDSTRRKIIRHQDANVQYIRECYFPPRGGFTEFYDAPTLWTLLAKLPPYLHGLGPVHGTVCVKPSNKHRAPPIGRHYLGYAIIPTLLLAGMTIAYWFPDRNAVHAYMSKPYGRRPGRKLVRPGPGLQ
jgi:hypothetical protein